MLKKSSFHWPK